MKNRQYIGKKTLATKVTRAGIKTLSNDAWYNEPVGDPQLQALQQEVTFKAESQLNPYGVLLVEFTDLNGNLITTHDESGPKIDYLDIIITSVDDGLLKWEIGLIGPASPKWYARYIVAATDSGTIGMSADLITY